MKLQNYLQDGANWQARAVLMVLQDRDGFIEDSWNGSQYEAEPDVARWENHREQGYVCSLRNKKNKQLNIAWFEHRNSDNICAIRWIQSSINSPTIDTANFDGQVYSDKYDVSKSVGYQQFVEMADWIRDEFTRFWKDGQEQETHTK